MTRIYSTRTGFATLDRLLGQLHANEAELLRALERPDIPLHDLRLGERHPLPGGKAQDQRWHPLARPDAPTILSLPDLIRQRAQPP